MDLLLHRVDTPRLLLRQWVESDARELGEAIGASLDQLRPWMGWIASEPGSLDARIERIVRWREEWESGGDSVLGVFLGGSVIGGTGLHRRIGPGGVEIGYWIHADHVGRGYATETVAALTDAMFLRSDVDRVEVHHDRANRRSGAVPRRLGFVLAAEEPRAVEAPNEIGVEWQWRMSRAEWPAGGLLQLIRRD